MAICNKGKSCGASCVQRSKHCVVLLSKKINSNVADTATKIGVVTLFENVKNHKAPKYRARFEEIRGTLRAEIGGQIRKPEHVLELKKRLQKEGLLPTSKAPKTLQQRKQPSKKTKEDEETSPDEWEYLDPKDFDRKLDSKKLSRVGDTKYNGWSESSDPRAEYGGEGSYGSVTVNPDGKFIKRGIISGQEAEIMQRLHGKDLAPGLIAADLNGRVKAESGGMPDLDLMANEHLGLRHGRIAMTRVPGKDLKKSLEDTGELHAPETKINGTPAADIYWKAMADLHREGIAHNDAHPGNLFVGSVTSKGRWVDFGLSQASPKAALAEALGAFANPSMFHDKDFQRHLAEDSAAAVAPDHISGNWQTREWNAAGTWRTDKIQARPGREALAKELPVLGKILKNRIAVNKMLEKKYGLNEGEILAIYAHGIRSPMSSYQQGPWQKLTDKDAQEIIQALYKGV